MFDLPADLHADLVPLSWLLGVWEGTGVIEYDTTNHGYTGEFAQRVSFSHDGGDYLNYSATAHLTTDTEGARASLVAETGYWRLARPRGEADAGPALLPASAASPVRTVDDVERLRTADGGFEVEAAIVHSDGISELYLGSVAGPRIDIATDAVVRPPGAKNYAAATRMYGLVEAHLLWAWDIAAFGSRLRSHASARLAKAD